MSIASALNNAVTGLTANARMAEVVSSNLANALTDGYARRSVDLSAVQVGGKGGGVQVDGIRRYVDAGLLADRRLADAALGGQDERAAALIRLERELGAVDDPKGLSGRLAAFEAALISAASDPASETRLETVVSRLQDVATTLNANNRTIQTMRQDADAAIAADVNALNTGLERVAALNRDILRVESTGQDASALRDARQRAVDQIAEIVPVREITRENGTIGLMTTNGVQLLDLRPVEIGFTPTPTITADMTLGSGALSGLTLNGVPLDPATGVGRLTGGTLGAAFTMRDETLVAMQAELDTVAADLVARLQDATNDPSIAPGAPGLLTDLGGPLDLPDLPGLAGRVRVNDLIVPAAGGDVTALRDGLYAAAPLAVGDPTQLNRWAASLQTARADVPGAEARSAAGRIAAFTAGVGATRLEAEETLSFAAARWDTLREAELAMGVDSDVEMQTLLRVEQAYAANARVIETVDFMMRRLMEI